MDTGAVPVRRWTRHEYDCLVEQGFFGADEELELLDGALIVKEPQYSPHYTAVVLTHDALRAAFGPGWFVRMGGPIALDESSEPEPDVSVVPGAPRDYRDAHPSLPALVVEVSESRLRFDRTDKAAIYARAGVADHWIVDLVGRVLEVHREPALLAGPPDAGNTDRSRPSVRTMSPARSSRPRLASGWPTCCRRHGTRKSPHRPAWRSERRLPGQIGAPRCHTPHAAGALRPPALLSAIDVAVAPDAVVDCRCLTRSGARRSLHSSSNLSTRELGEPG